MIPCLEVEREGFILESFQETGEVLSYKSVDRCRETRKGWCSIRELVRVAKLLPSVG